MKVSESPQNRFARDFFGFPQSRGIVNSIGNLSGFFGPYAMGYIKDKTGSYAGGLWSLAICGFIAMGIVLLLRHDGKLEEAPDGSAVPAE